MPIRPIAHRASGVIRSLCKVMLLLPMKLAFSCALTELQQIESAVAKIVALFINLVFLEYRGILLHAPINL